MSDILFTLIQSVVTFFIVNIFALAKLGIINGGIPLFAAAAVIWFLAVNIAPTLSAQPDKRLKRLHNGTRLLTVFMLSVTASAAMLIYMIAADTSLKTILINSLIVYLSELVIFLNGTVRVYLTSVQMGIKWRLIGAVCGMIPIVNIGVLIRTIHISGREFRTEREKLLLDRSRADERLCATKYPLLMVHGVFFRDLKLFNYWGRVPETLERNGARIFYGNQQSAASVEESAKELTARIKQIVEESGCEKVNIIAHSKGGLDSRYAISCLGADKYVATLTTVNTPHRGCQFAEYLLNKVSPSVCQSVADKYNFALKQLGDDKPDFISAVTDLTASRCAALNEICSDSPHVFYQSVGSKSLNAAGGQFPLNMSYHLVKHFDGDNDGLVSVDSMKWGEKFTLLTPNGKRGITHGDVIDLNRENIDGFDVREFYVGLVRELKEKGF